VVDAIDVIAERASTQALTIACAESLTSGAIAAALGRGENAASWFVGGVVAYSSAVKFDVLGVDEGPVVCASCAQQMAEGVHRLLTADAALAVTGVGGPDEEEGEPAGTVYIATRVERRTEVTHHRFDGDPADVVEQTVREALDRLAARL
jgi:nicotinamide-nucleotide amidase